MQKSKRHFLIINLFLPLVLASCATNNLAKDLKPVTPEKTIYNAPYFSNPEIDYVYKATINVYRNELSGIFIAKKINDATHRVVFTTEFGNKLLDFEISETNFKVNSIVDELNKKIIITTLKKDFRLILRSNYIINEQLEDEKSKVFKSDEGTNYNYLYINKSDEKLYKIVSASKRKEKIRIDFASEKNNIADTIVIQHYNIKLRIKLIFFKPN
ncbi:hypothetical protein [Flavobacterium sp.]|uniref:hypothetical protein n=1 Tax=Flavobacterium sp. TaxID=239 RepID=UPI0025EDF6DA|nr:hypothetical protein [Flavobacterium sp.]